MGDDAIHAILQVNSQAQSDVTLYSPNLWSGIQ